MKNLIIFSVFVLLLALLVNACKKTGPLCHREIAVKNVGQETVLTLYSFRYPDTGYLPMQANAAFLKENEAWFTAPGRTIYLERDKRECWEYVFKEKKELLSDTIMVAMYSEDFKLVKRLDLSLSDLRLINFTIMYSDAIISK